MKFTAATSITTGFSVGLLDYLGLTGTKGTLATTGGLNPNHLGFHGIPLPAAFRPFPTADYTEYRILCSVF
jgi:hypothetical protein